MAENTLPESDEWPEGIYQLETDDKVLGGADGVSNRQGKELASRTKYLKARLLESAAALDTHAASRNHPSATTGLKGLTRYGTIAEHAENREDIAATPAGVAARIAAAIAGITPPAATETVSGSSRQATVAEVVAGVSADGAKPHVTPEGVAAAVSAARWNARAIGERFAIQDHLDGAETPPNEEGGPRFIKLTAADPYNDGLLSDETVSGTAPAIQATAVIALATSPLYGQTIRLVNTERRFFRAGASGALEADAIRDITGAFHVFRWGDYAASGAFSVGTGTHNVPSGANSYVTQLNFAASNVVPTADENRPRNMAETNYMRIA